MHITVRPKEKLVGSGLKRFYRCMLNTFVLPGNWRDRPKFTISEADFATRWKAFIELQRLRRPRCTSDSQ